MFSRPRSLFWPYSNSGESPLFGSVVGGVSQHSTSATDDWPVEVESESELRQRLICTNGDGKCCLHTPDGLVQLAPEAVRKMTTIQKSKRLIYAYMYQTYLDRKTPKLRSHVLRKHAGRFCRDVRDDLTLHPALAADGPLPAGAHAPLLRRHGAGAQTQKRQNRAAYRR